MMIDAYTLLLLRSAGTGLLALITFVAFIMFYFAGENGTGRLFGIAILFISLYATMVATTGMAIVTQQDLASTTLDFYYAFWVRETIAVWAANVTIAVLGIYLLRRK